MLEPGPGAGVELSPSLGGGGHLEDRLQFVWGRGGLGCRTSDLWAYVSPLQPGWAAGAVEGFSGQNLPAVQHAGEAWLLGPQGSQRVR